MASLKKQEKSENCVFDVELLIDYKEPSMVILSLDGNSAVEEKDCGLKNPPRVVLSDSMEALLLQEVVIDSKKAITNAEQESTEKIDPFEEKKKLLRDVESALCVDSLREPEEENVPWIIKYRMCEFIFLLIGIAGIKFICVNFNARTASEMNYHPF